MVKIEAYVQPFRLDAIKAALDELGVEGASYFHVIDHGGREYRLRLTSNGKLILTG